jgi:HEAT repeat protein
MSLLGLGAAVGNAIAPWLGEWVTVAIAGSIVKGIRNQFDPDEMKRVLKDATAAAEAGQPETGGLFFRCQKGGRNGVTKFLGEFFQSGEVLNELQKPLKECGKPDVDVLVAAFTQLAQSAQQHSEVKNYLPASLIPWIETFVESYFKQIKGICFQVAKEQYLKQLARRVDDVKFVGIAVPGEEVEKQEVLAQIFVMPDVREEQRNKAVRMEPMRRYFGGFIRDNLPMDVSRLNDLLPIKERKSQNQERRNAILEEQKEWILRDRSAPRIPAQKVINLAQKKAVVLGAPGSGKTMLASYFALMLCGTDQSDPTQIGLEKDADYLPVVVRIRDWILQSNMGLLEYLRSNAESNLSCKELPTGFFEHWLDRGRALILLDGLDEVVDEAQRRKVAEQIETFLHQYQDNPAVITSRPAGYRWDFFNLDEFPHYTLESFDDKQVATFIDRWYNSRLKDDKEQAERRKADLQKAFARNERIRLLATNPLLLTIITLIHRYQAELPRQRCKLYEKAVETLLTSWDSGKEIKLYSQVLLFLKSDDLLYILKKLAYWIHSQGSTGETEGGTLIDKDELIRWLRKEIQTLKKCEAHEAKGEAERFIDFIQRRTGLLNEQGRDRYAFVHKTFQEYLTAEEIFDRADVEDDTEIILAHFRQHLHDQHWREVLLLLVSKLKGKKAQKAIQAVLGAESEYEQWLHRDLLFAGWCLTEDPPELSVVAQDFVGGILDRLVELEVENVDRVGRITSALVEEILSCFGETTLERLVLDKLQAQENRIGRFKLLELKAVLGQEAEVIDTLLSLLGDKDLYARINAEITLNWLGNNHPIVVERLLLLLNNKESNVRDLLVSLLGNLGHGIPAVINSLLALLHDEERSVCWNAALALSRLGDDSPEVVTSLISLLNDRDSQMRSNVATAIGQLGNDSSEVVNSLISLLTDRDSHVRFHAAFALGRLGNGSQKIVNGLISLQDDPDLSVRSIATLTLIRLGHTSSVMVNSLLSLLNDPDSNVRSSAITALAQVGNGSPEMVNCLLSLLNDPDSNVRSIVARAFERLENGNPEVVKGLLSLLDDDNPTVRSTVLGALVNLGISTEEVVDGWISLLHEEELVRSGVPTALGKLAKTTDTIRPKVLQWLEQNPNDDGIGSAIDCLWSIVVE